MQVSVKKETILDALQYTQSVISSKSTLPILNNVHIDARESKLALSATDLLVFVRCYIDADIKKTGATTLPARRTFSIFRELNLSDINLEVDSKDACSIKSGNSYFKILGLPTSDYPPLPTLENPKKITMPQAVLKELLRKTSYAISNDETRYVLNGVLLSIKESAITMVATDGRRLALAEHEQEFPQSAFCEVIIPTKAVNELQRILRENGEVKISISDNQISFDMQNITLYSKLTEGNYPNYRQVIPTEVRDRVTIEREAFSNMVRRVAIMTSENSSSIKLQLTKDNLTLYVSSPELGEARESLPVKYNGRDLTIAFNPVYLQDPLRALDSDIIHFDFLDELSPGVLRTNSSGFLYVIMPMRVA